MDWYSRKPLLWRLSNTLDARFCVDAQEEAIWKYGQPAIFNTDQGSQFTSNESTEALSSRFIKISMDGQGLWTLVKKSVREVESDAGVLIINDTIQEKVWTETIMIITWHYDHCKNLAFKWVNILN